MSTLTTTTYTMPAASLGKENPLPDLKSVADAPMMPIFHSTPPEIQALRRARLQGWKTGFTCSSSRPASLS